MLFPACGNNHNGERRHNDLTVSQQSEAGMVGLAPKCVRLATNGTNPGLFQIRFQCTEI